MEGSCSCNEQIFNKLRDNQLKATLVIFATEFQIIWPVTLIALYKLFDQLIWLHCKNYASRLQRNASLDGRLSFFTTLRKGQFCICFNWIILVGLFVHILWKFVVAHYLHLLTNGKNQEPRKFGKVSLWDFYNHHNSFRLFCSDKSTGWYWPDATYK